MPQPLLVHDAVEMVDAPSVAPVSVAEVKEQLRIAADFTDEDAYLGRLIGAAVSFVDVQGVLGHAMITQKWAQWFSSVHPHVLTLSLGQVQAVTAVKYYDAANVLQTDTLGNYEVTGRKFGVQVKPRAGFAWPVTSERQDAIRIEYEIGYGDAAADVPDAIRHAIMMLVGHWYDNREGAQEKALSEVPYGFMELMNANRRSWYG